MSLFAVLKQKGPIVIVRFQGVPTCDGDINHYLDEMQKVYDKKEPFVVVYDTRGVGMISPRYIQMQANFMRAKEQQTRHLLLRAAVVVSSQLTRTLLNMLFKVKKPACPLEVFEQMDVAMQYVSVGVKEYNMAKNKKSDFSK